MRLKIFWSTVAHFLYSCFLSFLNFILLTFRSNTKEFKKKSILPIDETLKRTKTQSQSGAGSNGNTRLLHVTEISRITISFVLYSRHLFCEVLLSCKKYSQRIWSPTYNAEFVLDYFSKNAFRYQILNCWYTVLIDPLTNFITLHLIV